MSRRLNQLYAIWIIASIWLIGGLLILKTTQVYAADQAQKSDIYTNLQLFNEVLIKLKQNYVTDLDNEELIKAAISGMLGSTDPHTNYFPREDFTDFSISLKGDFGGLGIHIDKKGDYITVVSPIEGTPAYKMGITAGDKITKVDGVSIVGASSEEAIRKMRGPIGTKVTITILRPGIKEPMDFEIVRDIIKIRNIPYAFKMDNGIGYMRVTQFNENILNEMRATVDSLENKGITGMIIDLRFNPGGLLNQVVDVVNEFIGANKLVVETKGRIPTSNQQYYTKFNKQTKAYPIVILVNEATASAAEIFAGSLQDWDIALVVGKQTFGKGSVQQVIPLSNGDGVKVTTSYYYIKSGRCINKMLNDKLLSGKEVTRGEIKEIDKKNHDKVFFTVKGRKVYGGGGITPDIEVEPNYLTNLTIDLLRKNILFNFAVDYMVKHEHFVPKDFRVSDDLFSDFLTFAKNQGIKYSQTDVDSSAAYLKNSLTSEIIGKQYGDLEAYKITIRQDMQLQRVIDLFKNFKTIDSMFEYAATQTPIVKTDS